MIKELQRICDHIFNLPQLLGSWDLRTGVIIQKQCPDEHEEMQYNQALMNQEIHNKNYNRKTLTTQNNHHKKTASIIKSLGHSG